MKKNFFLSINEDINSGLLKSQLINPVKLFLKKNYKFISINRPFF